MFRFPKKARGHSMCSTMVDGSWRLAVGGWQLATGGWWRLVVGGWWRLAVDGSWWLVVGGPSGRSLRAVLSKKKKISSLKDPPGFQGGGLWPVYCGPLSSGLYSFEDPCFKGFSLNFGGCAPPLMQKIAVQGQGFRITKRQTSAVSCSSSTLAVVSSVMCALQPELSCKCIRGGGV